MNSEKKLLSIIIPSYNMEAYLPKCLASLIVDDKNLMQNLEVIVVNDGSKDRTSEIAHEFEAKYPGVFRVVDKANGNYGSCVNAALKIASGAFVKILDADDTYDKQALSRLIDVLAISERGNENVDMFLSPYVRTGAENEILRNVEYQMLSSDKVYQAEDLMLVATSIAMHAIAYRTRCLREIGYHQTEGISYTDTEWCFMPIIAVRKWRYVPFAIYRYFVGREGQTVSRTSTIKNFWMYRKLFEGMVKWYEQGEFQEVYRPYLRSRLESLAALLYQAIVGWIPSKSALNEFDAFDATVQLDADLYREMAGLSLSRIFRWRYVAFLRTHKFLRKGYLVMLKTYLFGKDLVCVK